ncbi:glucose-6-phosphate/phosphate translocator 1, chloroplastic-like protein [Tanacetum coccineum]
MISTNVIKRNPIVQLPNLPSLTTQNVHSLSTINISKPLHISSMQSFGSLAQPHELKSLKSLVTCKARDSDGDHAEVGVVVEKAEAARKVLNAFPFPWLTSTLSLAAGSLIMLVSWGVKVAEAPNTDLDFWKSLFPVALAHTIGHVAATVSMSKVAVFVLTLSKVASLL